MSLTIKAGEVCRLELSLEAATAPVGKNSLGLTWPSKACVNRSVRPCGLFAWLQWLFSMPNWPQVVVKWAHYAIENGAKNLSAAGIAGVVFTDFTQVAKTIHRALPAKRTAPSCCGLPKTGGINAILVDYSALPEQVVDALMQSAFRSASQRCPALRRLFVHESLADGLIDMIRGAAQELAVVTDLGSLIDREAFKNVQKEAQQLISTSNVPSAPVIRSPAAINLIAKDISSLTSPVMREVGSLAEVLEEILGPVLQIVRWSGDPLRVVDFKGMAEEAVVPYQGLINLYLRDCLAKSRKVQINWAQGV